MAPSPHWMAYSTSPELTPVFWLAARTRTSMLAETGVFFAWACATAEQAMCMEAHHRVCLHQNGASQSYHDRDYFARWAWRMFSWFNKMCSLQKTLTLSQKRSRPALTYHELLSNFISRLDLDYSARICSACRIALFSSKSKQSAETFVDVSKHFQFSLFWNGKGTQILKKNSKFERVGSKVRKSRLSVQQWINICSTIFPALWSYKIKSTRDVD